MSLPIAPPFLPMEAQQVNELPEGEAWQYEPKWDGFRCIAFRDGDHVDLQSKSAKPLARYFPEIVDHVLKLDARQFVLDGEIVIPVDNALSFEELLQRIHPAESRVRKLAASSPGLFVAFDLLVGARGEDVTAEPLRKRREKLEQFADENFGKSEGMRLSPCTRDADVARKWLTSVKGGLDGVMAKRLDAPYMSGERRGMQKIKTMRTVDCVVGGFRYGSKGNHIGSLLLGLYDEDGLLHHVGFTSSFKRDEKDALKKIVEPLIEAPGFTGRAPGGPSRWSTERSGDWQPLQPKLVVEVQYDHYSEGRFRHGTKFLRWRPDKAAEQCTMDQVARDGSSSLKLL